MSVYNTKEAFEVYTTYLAIKRHFTSSYDYFKYNGKINASLRSFETRRDRFHFYNISKKKNWRDLLLANLVHNPKMWIGKMLDAEANQRLLDWQKKQQAFSYYFEQDIKKMDFNFNANFKVLKGQWPPVVKMYNRGEISLETLAALTLLVPCESYWNENVKDSIIFPDIMNLVVKYRPWLTLDKAKLKKIIQKNFQ